MAIPSKQMYTTVLNTLVITAQWNTNNAGNSIYSEIFTLNKTY
jgi:hypothetical protein